MKIFGWTIIRTKDLEENERLLREQCDLLKQRIELEKKIVANFKPDIKAGVKLDVKAAYNLFKQQTESKWVN